MGTKTNAKGDDEADYDAASRTITFRVGTGATSAAGGKVKPGETVTVTFRAKVVATKGTIANQAILEASGEAGGPKKTWKSDGDPNGIGTQPTDESRSTSAAPTPTARISNT